MSIRQHERCKAKVILPHRRQNQLPVARPLLGDEIACQATDHAIPPLGILLRKTLPDNGQMVRPKPIPRRNRVHRHAGLQAFCNDLRLDLIRLPLLAIGPYLHPVVPEKLHRSRHRETPDPISISCGVAGKAKTGKVRPRKRLRLNSLAAQISGHVSGPLLVGCMLTFAQMVLPQLRRGFVDAYPEVMFQQTEEHQTNLIDGLRRGRLDVVLTYDL